MMPMRKSAATETKGMAMSKRNKRMDAILRAARGNATTRRTVPASLSPQRGEGLRVRGDAAEKLCNESTLENFPPLTPALSPLRGEGEECAMFVRSRSTKFDGLPCS